jgi:hypothetical protein
MYSAADNTTGSLCVNVENNVCQTGQSALCMLHNWGDSLRLCNSYSFSTATMVTRTQSTVTLYIQCLLCSLLRLIAVHMHSVFCVPCTVCDNVLQYADTAIHCGNCSVLWDAVLLQHTCTEGWLSVLVHNQVQQHGRMRTCSVEKLYIILRKSLETLSIETGKRKSLRERIIIIKPKSQ